MGIEEGIRRTQFLQLTIFLDKTHDLIDVRQAM